MKDIQFDANGIKSLPGYRPTGKSGSKEFAKQPEAETPEIPLKQGRRGGFVGSRADKFIQDNQFIDCVKPWNPLKGTPLSIPDSDGNEADTAVILRPFPELKDDSMRMVLEEVNRDYTAKELAKFEEARLKKQMVDEAVNSKMDAVERNRRDNLILNAMGNGFSKAEAEAAYDKMRIEEALIALKKEKMPSERIDDILRTTFAGAVDDSVTAPRPQIRAVRTSLGTQSDFTVEPTGMTLVARPSRYRRRGQEGISEGVSSLISDITDF